MNFRFDPESEGFVSTEELEFVLSNLPVKVSKPEIEEMLAAADTDNDGKISFQEFRRLVGMWIFRKLYLNTVQVRVKVRSLKSREWKSGISGPNHFSKIANK